MGKSLPSTTRLQEFVRIASSEKFQIAKRGKPAIRVRVAATPETVKRPETVRVNSDPKMPKKMDSSEEQKRMPLADVVSDCVKRWFEDTLKAAKSGDISMQVLVGQMYCNGYGVTKNAQKGRAWMSRAFRIRSSVWKLSNKPPGYNASDSDSDEPENEVK